MNVPVAQETSGGSGVASPTARVMGLVLTYGSPDAAARCVATLDRQTHPLDRILITDNASPQAPCLPVDRPAGAAPVELERLPRNVGPAGGHAAGLRRFAASGLEWAWIMDDDAVPAPDALETLLRDATALDKPCIALPTVVDADTGTVDNTQGWCGVLIHRDVVRTVGLPNEALFWWTEDTEYLQWRIPQARFPHRRSSGAVVSVHRGRASAGKPAWKYYYEARNQVYHRLWVQRPGDRRPIPHHLRARVRAWRAVRSVAGLMARVVTRDRHRTGRKLVLVARGAWDGLCGRLGHTVPVDDADRPVTEAGAGDG